MRFNFGRGIFKFFRRVLRGVRTKDLRFFVQRSSKPLQQMGSERHCSFNCSQTKMVRGMFHGFDQQREVSPQEQRLINQFKRGAQMPVLLWMEECCSQVLFFSFKGMRRKMLNGIRFFLLPSSKQYLWNIQSLFPITGRWKKFNNHKY